MVEDEFSYPRSAIDARNARFKELSDENEKLHEENIRYRNALEQVLFYGRVNHDKARDYFEVAASALLSQQVTLPKEKA